MWGVCVCWVVFINCISIHICVFRFEFSVASGVRSVGRAMSVCAHCEWIGTRKLRFETLKNKKLVFAHKLRSRYALRVFHIGTIWHFVCVYACVLFKTVKFNWHKKSFQNQNSAGFAYYYLLEQSGNLLIC